MAQVKEPLTRDQLLAKLRRLQGEQRDVEQAHAEADILLLDYINDEEITAAYCEIEKWYA